VSDIRNFSAFAAHRSPDETAAMLHAFTCIAVDVVEQHGGVVENVFGDSVLAVWNAYSECKDHPQQALAAAQELVRATRQLLASNQPISETSPVQPLALGIGLESGTAIVGSFGPSRRRAHAALGEPVSVANRIQQLTADLSLPILVGPSLAVQLGSDVLEPQGEYLLEGLSKHYGLFAPAGWAELVSTDPNWAASVAADPERQSDGAAEWSGWAEGPAQDASRPGSSNAPRFA
jgi:adenylate cyclase